MSAVNPYMPPRAQVADVLDPASEYPPVKIFSWRGRSGRLRYLAYSVAGYFAMILAAALIGAVVGVVGANPAIVSVGTMIAVVPYLVFMWMLLIQRSHDMDWSGWSTLLIFVPFAALIWVFKSGSERENGYGLPPPPNTWGVRVLAFVFPVIMVIGILAAVAIPAYQQYTIRAKAAQVR